MCVHTVLVNNRTLKEEQVLYKKSLVHLVHLLQLIHIFITCFATHYRCILQVMAATASVKPFSPEETRRILHHLQQPTVFLSMTCGWPVLHWSAEHLSGCLGDRLVRFRLGKKEETNGRNRRLIPTNLG